MDLLVAVGWYGFGIITGMLLIEARWRLKLSVVEKLAGKESNERPRSFISDEHKGMLILGTLICSVLLAIIAAFYYYNVKSLDSKNQVSQKMLKNGYSFHPYRPSGWYREGQEEADHRKRVADEIEQRETDVEEK